MDCYNLYRKMVSWKKRIEETKKSIREGDREERRIEKVLDEEKATEAELKIEKEKLDLR